MGSFECMGTFWVLDHRPVVFSPNTTLDSDTCWHLVKKKNTCLHCWVMWNMFSNPSHDSVSSLALATKWTLTSEWKFCLGVVASLFKLQTPDEIWADVVIRNHKGECLPMCSELLYEVPLPELADVRGALASAWQKGNNRITLASDCISVVRRIKFCTHDRSFRG
jgi:hypothetical protein